ncbi:MAG: DsbA family protein [Actinomycetota bacterium]|nr:DsbA family protein [Actinomycetota bacterium]
MSEPEFASSTLVVNARSGLLCEAAEEGGAWRLLGGVDLMIEVIEYTDPCCSWAWGSEPKLRRLRWRFDSQVSWRIVLGGLVDDSTAVYEGMTDENAGARLARYWSRVTEHTDMPYPVGLRWPPLTSHRMGQAVRAAAFQGVEQGEQLLRALREAIFVLGRPADTWERILDLAMTVPSLDTVAFARDLQSPQAEADYELDWAETRKPNDHVRNLQGDWPGIGTMKLDGDHERYAFPTVVVRGPAVETTLPGWVDYADYEAALVEAGADLSQARSDPDAATALATYGVLAPPELESLTGSAAFPADAVSFDWGAGEVAVSADVAERWRDAGWTVS